MELNYSELLPELKKIVIDAGDIIMDFYHSQKSKMEFLSKSDGSPVTRADQQAGEYISRKLRELYAEIPIISEEEELPSWNVRKNWNKFWLVDPLDGTKEFIKGLDEFTVNIALIENNSPTIGLIGAPALNKMYYADIKQGSWLWSKSSQSSERIYSNSIDTKRGITIVESRSHPSKEIEEFVKSRNVVNRINMGSSLKFCLIAEGKADVYPRFGPTMEWDVAAGDCIYRYSGKNGFRKSTLVYNKETLKNDSFIIGEI